ncbi:hypothetical protein GIB67_037141, partial [Kingdonia uniflora]
YYPIIGDNPLNSPFPLNSNILLHLPISHNLNHLNHMVLNRLTYHNSKTRGLLIEKKTKADVVRPRQLPMQGGRVSVVEMDGYSKQKSCKSLGSCLEG